jgi:hypothetical protein
MSKMFKIGTKRYVLTCIVLLNITFLNQKLINPPYFTFGNNNMPIIFGMDQGLSVVLYCCLCTINAGLRNQTLFSFSLSSSFILTNITSHQLCIIPCVPYIHPPILHTIHITLLPRLYWIIMYQMLYRY